MATVSVRVTVEGLDPEALELDLRDRKRLADAALRGLDKYVPMDTGTLRQSAAPTEYGVHYAVGYASYAEDPRGTIHTDKNPSAVAHWPEHYDRLGAPEVVEELEAILREKL